jgi:hypothetical protein
MPIDDAKGQAGQFAEQIIASDPGRFAAYAALLSCYD